MKILLQIEQKPFIRIIPVFLMIAVICGAACQSKKSAEMSAPENIVVVKSPADGVIIKVLVSEGANLGKDAGIVEIEIYSETSNAPPAKDLNGQSATIQNAQQEVENVQREVEQASVEMQRVEPLVASNSAPQSQLDAARADFQRAQEKLQAAREREKSRQTQMLIEKSRGAVSSAENVSQSKIIVARVPAAGILKVLNARVGQKVKAGQPLATVSQN